MGWNRPREKKDTVHYCSVHDRFQADSGEWRSVGEGKQDMINYVVRTRSIRHEVIETPCDECG